MPHLRKEIEVCFVAIRIAEEIARGKRVDKEELGSYIVITRNFMRDARFKNKEYRVEQKLAARLQALEHHIRN